MFLEKVWKSENETTGTSKGDLKPGEWSRKSSECSFHLSESVTWQSRKLYQECFHQHTGNQIVLKGLRVRMSGFIASTDSWTFFLLQSRKVDRSQRLNLLTGLFVLNLLHLCPLPRMLFFSWVFAMFLVFSLTVTSLNTVQGPTVVVLLFTSWHITFLFSLFL